ncbi:hypothetical protein BS78_03G396700 [Paspalum vaginatum]|nr:hypothetical protein BS78_03G396700 [Paspalum vaginatum]
MRGVRLDTICPLCKRLDEDYGHFFFKCKHVKHCWRLMNMEDIRETINKIWEPEKKTQMKVIVFMWRWWAARNKANEGGRLQSASEIQSSVTFFSQEFEKLVVSERKVQPSPKQSWKPPPQDFYKINIDGGYNLNTKNGGWGFVTDASLLASALRSKGINRSSIGCLACQIQEIMSLEFSSCIVSQCNRACNKVAESLASFGAKLSSGSDMYSSDVPTFVRELVSGDLLEGDV